MSMNKIKTRHVRVRDGKYTKRKGYSKNKKHYTRKHRKRIQKQKRLRRQTRRRVGGEEVSGEEVSGEEVSVIPSSQLERNSDLPETNSHEVVDSKPVNPEQVNTEPVATTPADVETPQMSEKDRIFQELIDSINFLNPVIDDIRKMLKVTNPFDTTCTFLCNPDECDEQMLEKLRQKYMEKIKNIEGLKIDKACQIFDDILNENLFLILENLYVQSKKMSKGEFKNLVNTCSTAIAQTFNRKNILHNIVFTLYSKFLKSYEISENESRQNLENMQKLLQLLNSMTSENMQKLLQLLNSMTSENMQKLLQLLNFMTPENMQKLLQLLNSMTSENMQKLLQLLNSMTSENMQKLLQLLNSMNPKTMSDLLFSLIHNKEKDNIISKILDDYIKLDTKSMAQLLELYSFIEKRDFLDNTNMYSVHRYLHGETPVSQRLLRNKKHKPTTCRSVKSLNATADLFKPSTSIINFKKDAEFQKVLQECELYPPQVVTGGGRKRKTLKKKRGGNSKR
jgi:hypothetical protein